MRVDMRPQHTPPPRRSFFLLALPLVHTHKNRRRCGGVGEVGEKAKRSQSSEREGARREVAKKKSSLSQPEKRGSPSTQQPSQLQPPGCQTWSLELRSIRRASFP